MGAMVGLKLQDNDFAVEYEIIPALEPQEGVSKERKEIALLINSVDAQIELCENKVAELNVDIDRLTNHADGLDYTIAVASGIISGIIDSLWVGEFSIDRANQWGKEKVDNFVVRVAQKQGYKGEDLPGAIRYLEENFPIAADKATNDFGGGLQHHLRDFSHHPTPVGLVFSLLTQFTEKVYGTDVTGAFKIVPINATHLIGKNVPEKLTFGVIHWFFHMVSDMAGSSTSASKGNLGTGLPGPLVSFLKEISAFPIFRNLNENGYKEFSVWISKLFNGTLLGKRDENGKLLEAVPFDLRTEISVIHELGRQAVPVLINECVVRGFYFIRRLLDEIKENEIKTISDLRYINWKDTLPWKNRTVVRMLTIATGTFTAVDMADATIRSGGFNAACLLRVNFVGVGRFAVAIGTDVGMGIKKSKLQKEKLSVIGQQLDLMNIKVYYKCTDLCYVEEELFDAQSTMWISAESTTQTLAQAYDAAQEGVEFCKEALQDIYDDMERISQYREKIDRINPGVTNDLLNILRWGEK